MVTDSKVTGVLGRKKTHSNEGGSIHLSSAAIVSYLFLMDLIEIKALSPRDFEEMAAAFGKLGWNKPKSQYEAYYAEQTVGVRSVLIARLKAEFAGYVTIRWLADYTLFLANHLPEIQDLNVLPQFRMNGLGERLMRECEAAAKQRGMREIGLGVGLLADYGSAQRLYLRLGYIPDGRGLHYKRQPVGYRQPVVADDDLVLYLSKRI
jgi:ribosomal protein S18 acetylase RimI-like enzyme